MSSSLTKALHEKSPAADAEPEESMDPDSLPDSDRLPDARDLQDRMPPHLQMSRQGFLLVLWLGLVFVMHSYTPRLWYTDLWGHLAYGEYIWTHGAIPATEPLMPLAKGMEFIDTAWLSQLIGFGMLEAFGITAIQFLYALCITLTCGIFASAVLLRTGSLVGAVGCNVLLLFIENQQFFVVRPQLAGVVCFAITFVVATQHQYRWWTWILLPVTFAAWANLHGSFIVGLLVLGAMLCGRAWDVFRRTRSLRAAISAGTVLRLFLMLQLCAATCLINPYGLAIYTEVLTFSRNPNLADIREWFPLALRNRDDSVSIQGTSTAILAALLIIAYRRSPRRITTGEALLLFGLGASALWSSRMLIWWGPVAAYYASIHLVACWRGWRGRSWSESPRGGLWTISTVGLVWIAFAFTPFGYRVVHGAKPTEKARREEFVKRTSEFTPHLLVGWLNEHPPVGQVFNPYEWGDYLIWAGPQDMQVFVASHAHLIPEQVWRDYMSTIRGEGDWEMNLRRYGVNTVILNKPTREDFIAGLKDKPEEWDLAYEDFLSAVFVRKDPL